MIRNTTILVMAVLVSGCHVLPWSSRRQTPVGPPLPMSVSRDDLVDHLNQQSGNLKAWQCTNVRLTASLPGPAGSMMPAMKGNIACESPNRFHLTARNTFASVDMGANSEHCWFRSTPGHDGVIFWRHEDAHLLQELPQIPYIDPDWLMLVLGVKQLEPEDYMLEPGDDPRAKELWLTSNRETPDDGVYRYVIKVSTQQRVVHEHAAYDQDYRLIVKARLSDHQWFDGHLIPRTVRVELPANEAELKLSFSRIETDPVIDTAMWGVPSFPNGDNIDLAQLISRAQYANAQPQGYSEQTAPRGSLGAPQFQQLGGATQTVGGPSDWTVDGTPKEPNWTDSAEANSPFRPAGYQQPRRRRFWGLFPALW